LLPLISLVKEIGARNFPSPSEIEAITSVPLIPTISTLPSPLISAN